MTNEEQINRRIAFIIEHQSQFATDIQQLREAQVKTESVVAQTGEIVARLAYVTSEGFKDVNAKINALVDAQVRADGYMAHNSDEVKDINSKLDALADAQIRTEENLALASEQIKQTDIRIDALGALQGRTEENLARTSAQIENANKQIQTLAITQTRTEESLKNLATIVHRNLPDSRNG